MFFGTVVSSSCLLVEFVGGVLLVRGSAPESKRSTGGSAPAEPPSDAIGWRVGSPVRLPRVGDGSTGSDYRTEIVDSRRPTKGPGQVADPQSFQTGVCRVQPSTPAGGRPVDPWAGRTLRPGQPDHLGGRPYGPAGDTGPLWPAPHAVPGRTPTSLPPRSRWPPRSTRQPRRPGRPRRASRPVHQSPCRPPSRPRPSRRRRTPLLGPPGSHS